MATATINTKPIVHSYKEIKKGKYKTTRHYELQTVSNGLPQLTKNIKISNNRFFNNSKTDYLLYQRDVKKWGTNPTTGLFDYNKIYYIGDVAINRIKKHTLIFKYLNDKDILIVYYFKDFYTRKIDLLINTID